MFTSSKKLLKNSGTLNKWMVVVLSGAWGRVSCSSPPLFSTPNPTTTVIITYPYELPMHFLQFYFFYNKNRFSWEAKPSHTNHYAFLSHSWKIKEFLHFSRKGTYDETRTRKELLSSRSKKDDIMQHGTSTIPSLYIYTFYT